MRPLARSILVLAALAAAAALLTAACGGDDDGYGSTSGGSPTKAAAAASPTTASTNSSPAAASGNSTKVVAVFDTAKGKVIADLSGMTLYTFKPDAAASGKSTCNASCATTWPPMTTNAGVPAQLDGATGTFGTIMRDDGATQVTFNNMPLYRFSGDKKAGDTNGDGVGSVWFVALASGPATASASPTTATQAQAGASATTAPQPTPTTAPAAAATQAPTTPPQPTTAPQPTPTTDTSGGYNYGY